MRGRTPQEIRRRCMELYAKGYTLEEVAKRVVPHMTQAGVRGVLAQEGVKLRSQSEAYEAKKKQHALWEEAYNRSKAG